MSAPIAGSVNATPWNPRQSFDPIFDRLTSLPVSRQGPVNPASKDRARVDVRGAGRGIAEKEVDLFERSEEAGEQRRIPVR